MAQILLFAPNAEDFAREIKALNPELEIATARKGDEAKALGADTEILITMGAGLTDEVLAAMPRLKWIQALSAGTDHIQKLTLPEGVALTSLAGAHGPQMSEYAILMMLTLPRRFRETLAHQKDHAWTRWPVPILTGKTLCIFGLGAIAEALVDRAQPFGMNITGVSDGRTEMAGLSRIYRYDELEQAAADADFLCILAPLTEKSRGSVDAKVLKALGPDGYLISLGRGPVIDEDALADALRDGIIGGAGLDVFAKEPLPADNPLWDMERAIITPHIGGFSDSYAIQGAPIITGNLAAWKTGGADALKNRVL
ncbi:hypothetical protein ATO6_15735 [Oceanicola sp. 22II-s10i]|uniref:D-2-hydroxyacid dehydrogenase n=1 Tax=Oceanicola sp. 22II-s10i TaxID=1317116 RepID=UPI000B527C55|nr:D-2-hydroxyacid dehydrogenase [Oceanicola sp. 22II-s10i]OWU83871.1 hypothetical protein ATO6_15735 [Oceanicola sp. 22II-s10i]